MPLIVLDVTVALPKALLSIAPPVPTPVPATLLPKKVLFVTRSTPPAFSIAPPLVAALLSRNDALVIVNAPWSLKMAPPAAGCFAVPERQAVERHRRAVVIDRLQGEDRHASPPSRMTVWAVGSRASMVRSSALGIGERRSERDGAILIEGDRVARLGGGDGGAQGAGARVGAGGDMAGHRGGMEDAGEDEGGEDQRQDEADQREPPQTSAHDTPPRSTPRRAGTPSGDADEPVPLHNAVSLHMHRHKCKRSAGKSRVSHRLPFGEGSLTHTGNPAVRPRPPSRRASSGIPTGGSGGRGRWQVNAGRYVLRHVPASRGAGRRGRRGRGRAGRTARNPRTTASAPACRAPAAVRAIPMGGGAA